MGNMRVSLVTLGDPGRPTGGYLFHQRVAHRASSNQAKVTFQSFPDRPFPMPWLWGPTIKQAVHNDDVVVLDSIAAAFSRPWLASGPPVVGMLHQSPGGIERHGLRRWLQEVLDLRAVKACAHLMIASAALQAPLTRHGIPAERISVVAPGRDVSGAAVEPIELRSDGGLVFLCIGNWLPRKGIAELLAAFARLPASCGVLHLVGASPDPSYSARVTALLKQPNIKGRVEVHGHVSGEEVQAMYAAADVFVLPSYIEPYGTVYGEALAAGLPVVGWRAGNLPNLAEHEREALIVEPGDVSALSDALGRLASDRELLVRLKAGAARKGAQLPTWDETAQRFFEILGRYA
jgi:glycosyltransferase involved in cell wall biosynthesis